jgi:hypothetical protein
MGLKFKEEVIQFRFTWDEGGDEECFFVVKQPSPRDFTRLTDQNTVSEWDAPKSLGKKARMQNQQRFTKLNHEGFMDDKVDFLIVDWGVGAADGTPLPCTRENKIKFDKGRSDITSWLFEKLDSISEDAEATEDEDEGK